MIQKKDLGHRVHHNVRAAWFQPMYTLGPSKARKKQRPHIQNPVGLTAVAKFA